MCNVSDGDLGEKFKPLITEKYELEDRDESKILGLFGVFGLSTFWTKERNDWLLIGLVFFYKIRAVNWDLYGRHQGCMYRKKLNLGLNLY